MKIYDICGKRIFDLFFSLAGIFLLSPLFLCIAILIKVDSKGPVFFVQNRMGLNGRPFPLIKFRTMYNNAEREKLSYEPGVNDRVTPLGKILRKTKLDELPQFINVFKGDMSFVGPRPEIAKYKDYYSGKYAKILSVKPGITDRASIKYRDEENLLSKNSEPKKMYEDLILPDKLKINLEYANQKRSFIEDVKIIAKTMALWAI